MAETSIQWTDHSVNPLRARHKATGAIGHYCERLSPGCGHCYSSTLQTRFNMPEFPGAKKLRPLPLVGENGRVSVSGEVEAFLDASKLAEVVRRKKPTKYFWCDMTDIFGEWVPDEWIDQCFGAMAITTQHTHQILTKRPERMASYIAGLSRRYEGMPLVPWPLPNVWLGASVENQEYADKRIVELLKIPAAVRFLSVEPLLGPIEFSNVSKRADAVKKLGRRALDGIDWVIIGGESGTGARACDLAWIRSLVAQCQAAGVACFVKQLGSRPIDPTARCHIECGCGLHYGFRDRKGGSPDEWPADLRIREFPEPARA